MPRGSQEDRDREHKSWTKKVHGIHSREKYHRDIQALKSAIVSGKMDNFMIIPTEALDKAVFEKYNYVHPVYGETGRMKKRPKAFLGSNREHWDALVAMAEGNSTVGMLRDALGNEAAASSIAEAKQQGLIDFDEYRIQNVYGQYRADI